MVVCLVLRERRRRFLTAGKRAARGGGIISRALSAVSFDPAYAQPDTFVNKTNPKFPKFMEFILLYKLHTKYTNIVVTLWVVTRSLIEN